jgi:hypothetical protein
METLSMYRIFAAASTTLSAAMLAAPGEAAPPMKRMTIVGPKGQPPGIAIRIPGE